MTENGMSKALNLELVTPEKLALSCRADFIVLPALLGEMGVLPGHEPYMVELRPGEIRVTSGGELTRLAVAGGFAQILEDKVSVFAETADAADEIDAEAARQELERAKARVAVKGLDPHELAKAVAALRFAQTKVRVAELKGVRGPKNP